MFRRLLSFQTAVWILVAGILFNVTYIGFLALYPFKTIEFHNEPFPIMNTQPIKAGEPLQYVVDYCRYTDVPSHLTRTLTGPTVITIVQDTATADTGCQKVTVTNTVIPSYAPAGKYYLKIEVCYQVNPLRNICHQVRTKEFEVVK